MLHLCCIGICTPTKRKLLNWFLLLFSSSLYLKKAGKSTLQWILSCCRSSIWIWDHPKEIQHSFCHLQVEWNPLFLLQGFQWTRCMLYNFFLRWDVWHLATLTTIFPPPSFTFLYSTRQVHFYTRDKSSQYNQRVSTWLRGTLLNRAHFDEKLFENKQNKVAYDPANPFSPFSNTEQPWRIVSWDIMLLGAARTTCIKVEDFEEGDCLDIPGGLYNSIPYNLLKSNHDRQKNNDFTLKNHVVDTSKNTKKKTFPYLISSPPCLC